MKLESLEKLYVHELKDLYSAEKQILEAMPKMIEKARDEDLKKALADHREQTEQHIERLETIFRRLDFEPGGHHCVGMEGLIKEAKSVLESDIDEDVIDAALVAGAQRIEHYEIAGYGVARTFAEKLGHYDASDLLQKSLREEGEADTKLSRLAERRINFTAMTTH